MASLKLFDRMAAAVALRIEHAGAVVDGLKGRRLTTAEAVKLSVVLFLAVMAISLAVRLIVPAAPGVVA